MAALTGRLAWAGDSRLLRLASAAAALAILGAGLLPLAQHPDAVAREWGTDLWTYRDAAARWLSGGGFYEPYQLAGPYAAHGTPHASILYPPAVLWLLAPFTVLPAALWWLLPGAVVALALWRLRPAWWSWPLLALMAAWPRSLQLVVDGNPSMWAAAAVAAACMWGWPGALVLLKPTLAPLALAGVRTPGWWLCLACLALASLPLLPLWADYARAVLDGSGLPLWYSLADWPLVALPLAVRAASSTRPTC